MTAFIRTRADVGLGGVVAFLLLCGAISPNTARADAPLSLIRQVATIYAAPTVIDSPWAIGDMGKSRGLWQIHSGYNPTVSDSEAFGIRSSTRWAVQRILRGEGYKWSCFRSLQW